MRPGQVLRLFKNGRSASLHDSNAGNDAPIRLPACSLGPLHASCLPPVGSEARGEASRMGGSSANETVYLWLL